MSNLKEYIVSQIFKYDKEKQTLKKELSDLRDRYKQLNSLKGIKRDEIGSCDMCQWPDLYENLFICDGNYCLNVCCDKCVKKRKVINGQGYCENCV